MLKRNTEDDRQVYEEYGKRSSVMTMLYLRDDLKIEMINSAQAKRRSWTRKSRSKGAEPMRYLTFALTEGRLPVRLLICWKSSELPATRWKIKLTQTDLHQWGTGNSGSSLQKVPDVPTYCRNNGAGRYRVVGKDTIIEEGRKVHEVLDLGFGKCRMCVCGREETAEKLQHHELIRVATKYPNIAKD